MPESCFKPGAGIVKDHIDLLITYHAFQFSKKADLFSDGQGVFIIFYKQVDIPPFLIVVDPGAKKKDACTIPKMLLGEGVNRIDFKPT